MTYPNKLSRLRRDAGTYFARPVDRLMAALESRRFREADMRRLFWQMSVTLDGFMEGPNRELDDTAQVVDEDFDDRYANDMLQSIDAVLLGRRTYELFADYWPSATGPDAHRLNELPKLVFSRTLEKVEWRNSRLVKENIGEEVTRLKHQPGNDIALFGSADLASTFLRLGLIDEYRILVSPVVLGGGTPMFKDVKHRVALKLSKATTWRSGVVALYYRHA
jgi:dihydrofolate reductase